MKRKNFKLLDKYKGLIEIIQNISLSIMAIIVSVVSCDISNRQLDLEYRLTKPIFEIDEYQIRNDSTGYFDNNRIKISNTGGVSNNINISLLTFIEFELTDSLHNSKLINYNIFNYYGTTFTNGTLYGVLEEKVGYDNNKKFVSFSNEIEEKLKEKYRFQFVFIDLIKILEIQYKDINNSLKKEFYSVNVNKVTKLNDTAASYFEEFSILQEQGKYVDLTDFETINYDSLSYKLMKEFYND